MSDNFIERHFENTPVAAASALRDCSRFLTRLMHPIQDIELALAEAINNVVDHAYVGRGQGTVRIKAEGNCRLICTIADEGVGFGSNDQKQTMPHCYGKNGFGLSLMKALADDTKMRSSPKGTQVTMHFRY